MAAEGTQKKTEMKAHHLTDTELRAVQTEGIKLLDENGQQHLQQCPECHLALQLLQSFPVSGRLPLTSAPDTLVARAVAIPSEKVKYSVIGRLVEAATLLFDSWASPVPVGVRGGQRTSRRLRFSAIDCELDLQLSRDARGWHCTARAVSVSRADLSGFAIKIGRQTYLPDSSGFVTWTSLRPPQLVSVVDGSAVVLQAAVNWDRTDTRTN